ncbi:MAG: hypothetical protein ABR498_06715 [Candidatus Dormibacteria bacterium]
MTTVVVAVDGGGGAGKSSFAARLVTCIGDAVVIPTDDFASWEDPLGGWPRVIEQVLEPLRNGCQPRWQRYDWRRRTLGEWTEVASMPTFVVLEGVGAMRREFNRYLSYASGSTRRAMRGSNEVWNAMVRRCGRGG